MAHYLAGTATGPGAAADFLNQLVTHLQNNGWTKLWGTAGVNAMMRGAPLDATADNAPYIWFSLSGNNLSLITYLDADSTAQVGIQASTSQSFTLQDASFAFWVRANGVSAAFAAKVSALYSKSYCGYVRRGLPSHVAGMTKSTGAIAVGATSIPIASDMTGKLMVGQKVAICNAGHNNASANKTNMALVTITGITGGASPSLQVSATTKAFDAGAIIGTHVHQGFVGGTTNTLQNAYSHNGLDGATTSSNWNMTGIIVGTTSTGNPEGDTGWYGAGVWSMDYGGNGGADGHVGTLYHLLYYVSGGQPQPEDVLTNGDGNTYLVNGSYTSVGAAMGPREN